ncbi:hypothetical protein BDN70DRAFT_872740 [Pholiota conissans]|uniref:Uncharacterized protein n=1 Tax=Pholiota conissans TaxID=109636 RepID=A0A9P5ZA22_9AGAR|nr:hypothetical protein BDN70DRAFT_872740 [Pholiota conissans]
MSSLALSNERADLSVVPSNDGRDAALDIPNDTDSMIDLDSFLPVVQLLPHLIVEDNEYHIEGPLTAAELQHFSLSTRRIRKLTLTNKTKDDHIIAPETLARLCMMQDPQNPFLSSLEHLTVSGVDANQSSSYLFFCLVPSLKILEIDGGPSTRQIAIFTFLQELVLKALHLSNLTLGPGYISEGSLRNAVKFRYLRHLRLIDAAKSLDFEFLQNISVLPELESLEIDARTAEYTQSHADLLSSTLSIVDANAIHFPQLQKLNLVANILLIGDIIHYLLPPAPKEVKLTLVQNGRPLSLPPLWNKQTPVSDNVVVAEAVVDQKSYTSTDAALLSTDLIPPPPSFSRSGKHSGFKGRVRDRTPEEEEELEKKKAAKLQKEQEKISANIVSQTLFFGYVIEEFLENATKAPDAIYIGRLERALPKIPYFVNATSTTSSESEFPPVALRMLLACSDLIDLRFHHWSLETIDKTLADLVMTTNIPSTSMRHLSLPIDKTVNAGITMTTLHLIAELYPRLTHFEGLVKTKTIRARDLELGLDFVAHGLEILSIGGGQLISSDDKIAVAKYLCLLFPNLQDIYTHQGYNSENWEFVRSLFKMCQSVRTIDESLRLRHALASAA